MTRKDKRDYTIICIVILLVGFTLFLVTGCGGEFTAGVGTGVALQEIADQAQNDFIIAVNAMHERAGELNAGLDAAEGAFLIKPKTIEAFQSLKGREKDPVTWIALASVLINAFAGGRVYTNRKRSNGFNYPDMPTVKDPLE